MPDLTSDQRWLLYFMGGWAIRDCLIGPTGTDHLMQSMWGSCTRYHPTEEEQDAHRVRDQHNADQLDDALRRALRIGDIAAGQLALFEPA